LVKCFYNNTKALNVLFYAQVGGILQESGGIGLIKKTGKIATIILYLEVAIEMSS